MKTTDSMVLFWGIGLSESDPRALDVSRWRGLNLSGQALMAARAALRQSQPVPSTPQLF